MPDIVSFDHCAKKDVLLAEELKKKEDKEDAFFDACIDLFYDPKEAKVHKHSTVARPEPLVGIPKNGAGRINSSRDRSKYNPYQRSPKSTKKFELDVPEVTIQETPIKLFTKRG